MALFAFDRKDFPLIYPAGSGMSPRLRQALSDPDATLVSQTITINYTYDPLYRLTAADYSDGTYFHYEYDAVGNRLNQTTVVGATASTYDDANRLMDVGGASYTWDANGNLLSDGVSTYTYDNNRYVLQVGWGVTRPEAMSSAGNWVNRVPRVLVGIGLATQAFELAKKLDRRLFQEGFLEGARIQ